MAGLLTVFWPVIPHCWWQSSRLETDLTVLPLGGGHAVYVDAAGRQNDWLVDCGNESAVNYALTAFTLGGTSAAPTLTQRQAPRWVPPPDLRPNFVATKVPSDNPCPGDADD